MSIADTYEYLQIVANSIHGNVAIIKPDGDIQCVNQNWVDFEAENNINPNTNWQALNYYQICKNTEGVNKIIAVR